VPTDWGSPPLAAGTDKTSIGRRLLVGAVGGVNDDAAMGSDQKMLMLRHSSRTLLLDDSM
jgi:hypothetical protein